MILVVKTSTRTAYLVGGGKIVLLEGANPEERIPTMHVSDATFDNLVTAFGPVVGSV